MPNNEYQTKQKQSVLQCLKANSDRALTADELTALLGGDGVALTLFTGGK